MTIRPLDIPAARAYLAAHPELAAILGGDPEGWDLREASDGFLNVVFLVRGPAGGLCLKQALPWVRHAGESWPLPDNRAFFEQSYLAVVGPLVEGALPKLHHYDPGRQILAMELLTPHETLRYALIEGRRFPRVSADIGTFVARACYRTSPFHQPLEQVREWQGRFAAGVELQRITLDLIFQDPYRDNPRSSWTSPQLDDLATGFREDVPLKRAAGRLAQRFLTMGQALIHCDLHTAAIMVTETDTKVIDPEFALYGPIGFDLGAYLANILISHLSQPGHATPADDRAAMAEWLLQQPALLWDSFSRTFRDLWESEGGGDAWHDDLFPKPASAALLRSDYEALEAEIFADMVGFAALKMIRRVFSYAHVADFLRIADPDRRAACERRTVLLARRMLTEPERFRTTDDIVAATRAASETEMTLTFQTHPIDLILLDIEGTISSQRYVLDVLYPFARERIPAFVARHPDHPVVQRALRETAERIEPGQDPVAALIAWQDADQKVPPLKLLQGLVWEEGYNEGAFKGHIYDDAHAALEGWRKAGVPMHIFSSGSVKAQVEFFQNSNRGDLRPYFGRHYDTDIGAKVVPESYLAIAADLGAAPDRILFLTDNPREVAAARQAGVHVVQVIRDESVKPNDAGAPIVAEFDQLRELVAFG